ncbi:UCH domain-containing protein [Cephalotus follicularis]|uniref:UCH domain-containing protein n=1 Tax=Cephalotus follicularis TaxID=3775 RepID=A0A1Q3DA78_CEPFO|nr:UCH domain-containing protein [Cephalotus follicularis]
MSLTDVVSFYTRTEEILVVSFNYCGSKVVVKKRGLVNEGSSFFILQLKRFLSPKDKIRGCITFPLSFHMEPHSSAAWNVDNDFYGMIVHDGRYNPSGHYYDFIYESSSWYKLDDEDFSLVSEQEVLKQEAYVLFYKRHAINTNATPNYFYPMPEESNDKECHTSHGIILHFSFFFS